MASYFPVRNSPSGALGGLMDEVIHNTPLKSSAEEMWKMLQREHDMRPIRTAPGRAPQIKFVSDPMDPRSVYSQRKAWMAAKFLARRLLPRLNPILNGVEIGMDIYQVWNGYVPMQPATVTVPGGWYCHGVCPNDWAAEAYRLHRSDPGGACGFSQRCTDAQVYSGRLVDGVKINLRGMWGFSIGRLQSGGIRFGMREGWGWPDWVHEGYAEYKAPRQPMYAFDVPWARSWLNERPWGQHAFSDSGNVPSNYVPAYVRPDPKTVFGPGVSVVVSPGDDGGKMPPVTEVPHTQEPNPPGEKQRKPRASAGVVGAVLDGIGKVDEVRQFIDALYKALPNKVIWFKGRDGKWHMRDFYPWEKAWKIYTHFDQLDLKKAAKNLAINELQDRAFGFAGQNLKNALQKSANAGYYRGLQGFQGGGFLRP